MYFCQVSKRTSKPNEKQFKLVTKTRKREYFEDREVVDENTGRKSIMNVKVGEGFEIVKEINVCEEVYRKHTGEAFIESAKEIMKTHSSLLKRLKD